MAIYLTRASRPSLEKETGQSVPAKDPESSSVTSATSEGLILYETKPTTKVILELGLFNQSPQAKLIYPFLLV